MSGKVIPFHRQALPLPEDDYDVRISRIIASMEKINRLMAELKAMDQSINWDSSND